MPVDASIFGRGKTYQDYEQAKQEFDARNALAMAQTKKAMTPDFNLNELGQKALIKKQLGLPTTPEEEAYANVYNASTEGSYTDAFGNAVQRPGIMSRLGYNQPAMQPPQGSPQGFPQAPQKLPPMAAGDNKNNIIGLFGAGNNTGANESAPLPNFKNALSNAPAQPPQQNNTLDAFVEKNPMPLTPAQKRQQKMDTELAKYANNPVAQKSIIEKYTNAESPTIKFDQENKLRDDFTAQTKTFREVQDAFSKVQKISDSPAGDIALLFAASKMNDPNSVVRESEFALQASAGNLGTKIQNMYNRAAKGNRLTDEQRAELRNEIQNLYNGHLQGYNQLKEQFNGIAYENELNPRNIITDYSQKQPSKLDEARKQFDEKNGYKTKSGVTYKVIK